MEYSIALLLYSIQWFLDTFSIHNIYLTVLVLSHLKDCVDVGMDTFSADNALPNIY